MGPMTGRGAGYCAGYPVPGYMNRGMGRGMGSGWGRRSGGRGLGRGWGRRAATPYWGAPYAAPAMPYGAEPTKEQELEMLKTQAESLGQALDDIRQRMSALEEDK